MGDDKAVLRKNKGGSNYMVRRCLPRDLALMPAKYSLPLRFRSFDEIDYVRSFEDGCRLIEGFQTERRFITFGLSEVKQLYTLSIARQLGCGFAKTKGLGAQHRRRVGINDANLWYQPIPLSIGDVAPQLQNWARQYRCRFTHRSNSFAVA